MTLHGELNWTLDCVSSNSSNSFTLNTAQKRQKVAANHQPTLYLKGKKKYFWSWYVTFWHHNISRFSWYTYDPSLVQRGVQRPLITLFKFLLILLLQMTTDSNRRQWKKQSMCLSCLGQMTKNKTKQNKKQKQKNLTSKEK